MANLISLSDVKLYAGLDIQETVHDNLLKRLIELYSDLIIRYCNRDFIKASFSEVYDGDGGDSLLLNHYPIISVSSLTIDTIAISSDAYVIREEKGEIKLIDGSVFTQDYENVEITYEAGESEIPGDIKLVCIDLVGRKFKAIDKGRLGVSSINYGDQNVSYITEELTTDIKTILNQYRKPKIR